ncbi:MAG: DUF2281 domain-containing protein [Waterburya sp.]
MTIKEQLFQEIESSPENLLEETLNFLRFLKTKQISDPDTDRFIQSTGRSLLAHLQTIASWDGDDFEECLENVYKTRGKVKFDDFNPFDE